MELHKSTKRALFFLSIAVFLILSIRFLSHSTFANTDPPPPTSRPWMNTSLSPDERADLVVAQMTLDEKVQLVHGTGWGVLRDGDPVPPRSNLGAGYTPGIDRLGIPDINLADSATGVRLGAIQSRYSTLLPSPLALAATWDLQSANLYGQVIGRELRDQGFNMSIGGGVDLAREPRNGRNWEYAGEDPLLAGTIVGYLAKGVQSQHVMGDIKHYALNDQETGRTVVNVAIDKRALRESDLLAFQIAIGISEPAGVMCSYNKFEGVYACENDYLLNEVLKKDFAFRGWVLSDWGGTHSTVQAAKNGMDMEQPEDKYFGDALKKAVQSGQVPEARLNDMVHRIVRSMFATGVVDHPVLPRRVVDPFKGLEDAQQIAEQSIVLLKNSDKILPLSDKVRSIAIIGSHADVGVLSGGGSAQVDAPGGNAIDPKPGTAEWQKPMYFPSSPLKYIRQAAPKAKVEYNAGTDPASAAALAKSSEVAIVFVNQFTAEDADFPLTLPDNQDALVKAVAAANPRTIVVIESGTTILMPWLNDVKGVLAAWYPGIGGGQAIANILFGTVNPSGKLPITFTKSEADLPHPQLPGMDLLLKARADKVNPDTPLPFFDAHYSEGARVGYKWFESENKEPLFPFGFGLSYTTFAYSGLKAAPDSVTFTVRNTGRRAGAEIAQVYATLPAAAQEPPRRLVGWTKVQLNPGESKTVTIAFEPLFLSIFNVDRDHWEIFPGEYQFHVGGSSRALPLSASVRIAN